MSNYEAIIGMEVHAQLLTRSKVFCGCDAEVFGAEPNTHVCPVCLGMPGVLPVINRRAVELTGFSEQEMVGRHCLSGIRCEHCLETCNLFEMGKIEDGEIVGIRCLEAEVGDIVDGRRQVKELPGTDHVIPGDMVIWALGQRPDFNFLPQDGSIATRRRRPLPISGPGAMRMTHGLRALHDGILVGIETVLADDPQLSVRLVEGPHPQPVVLDTRLRTPVEARLLKGGNGRPWLVGAVDNPQDKVTAMTAAGADVLPCRREENNGRLDFAVGNFNDQPYLYENRGDRFSEVADLRGLIPLLPAEPILIDPESMGVESAASLRELAGKLGVDGEALLIALDAATGKPVKVGA